MQSADKVPSEKVEFPTLQSIALAAVAHSYHLYPQLQGISERIKEKIIEKSIEDSQVHDVLLTAPNIQQQKYWKKCCEVRFQHYSTINLENHGLCWKVAYLERYVQNLIENVKNFEDPQQRKFIVDNLKTVSPWVFTVDLKRVSPKLDLNVVALYLPNLVDLKVKYSDSSSGEYRKQNLGMKYAEAANLAQAIKNCNVLLSLNISGNIIDDDLFKFVIQGISSNISLVELNLSHNKIGDQGARRISKYLIRNQVLTNLNLSNNIIGYDGSRYLSQALKINKTLETLNLKLNSLDDKAGAEFFKDLVFNSKLSQLDISANSLGTLTARKMSLYLQNPSCLREVHIGNNNFTQDHLDMMKSALGSDGLKTHFENSKFNYIKLK